MSYSGFGIQSMNSFQRPRKVFSNRFETKGFEVKLSGQLALKKETKNVESRKMQPKRFSYTALLQQITVHHIFSSKPRTAL